ALFAAAGLGEVDEERVSNPMRTVDHKLFLVELLDNMREATLEAKAASSSELDDLRADVETAARDPATVFHQARVHQVYGRRAGDLKLTASRKDDTPWTATSS